MTRSRPLVPRPPREPIYEAAFDATSSPRAHTPLDQCAATRNVEFDHATLLPTDFDGGGENERGAAAVTWEYPVPCHTEVVDRGAGHCKWLSRQGQLGGSCTNSRLRAGGRRDGGGGPRRNR